MPLTILPVSTVKQPNSVLGKQVVHIQIDEHYVAQRLDNFLFGLLKGVPKSLVYRIVRKGEVRINKKRAKQTSRLALDDIVRIPPIRLPEGKVEANDAHGFRFLLDAILFEDEAMLILNKPSGVAVHGGSGVPMGVIEALRQLRGDIRYLELVHRLDRETSGCLVMAKTKFALRKLNEDFAVSNKNNKRVGKRYHALAKGRWRHGARTVIKPLDTTARRSGERHVVVSEQGSFASSVMTPIRAMKIATLLEVQLLTGRTHQVRVHAASEGHPLAGDARYGDVEFNQLLKQAHGLKRLFLHAHKITLHHPVSQTKIVVEAPMPNELERVIRSLSM